MPPTAPPKQASTNVVKAPLPPEFADPVPLHQTTVDKPPVTDIGPDGSEGVDQHGRAFRVIGGRKVIRVTKTCPITGFTYKDAFIDPIKAGTEVVRGPNGSIVESRRVGREIPGVGPTGSPASRFYIWDTPKHAIYQHIVPRPINPLRDELRKLSKDYPALAEILRNAHVQPDPQRPEGPFPLGPVKRSPTLDRLHVYGEEIETYLARHLAGDHGVVGSSVDLEPNELADWAPALADILYQNADAVKTGFGLVKSRYPLYDETHRVAEAEQRMATPNQPFYRRPGDYLDIITLVAGPSKSETICVTNRDI